MAGLNTNSWNAPMPESLAEVHIEYPTGLRVVPGCAQDIVAVAVPGNAALPVRPGCGFPENAAPVSKSASNSLLRRAEAWLHRVVH